MAKKTQKTKVGMPSTKVPKNKAAGKLPRKSFKR